jgi:hypothetical protein
MGYKEGADLGLDFMYPFQHFNRIKNHWRQSGVKAALTSAVVGMIVSEADDDRLWHRTGDSLGWDEILQANESYLADVIFNELILLGDFRTSTYNRKCTCLWMDSFDHGTTIDKYQKEWQITALNTQGAGTNTIDTTPGHVTLTTDNNAIGDNEGTRSVMALVLRERKNRSEIAFHLGQTANTQFYFGWNDNATNGMNPAADKYVIVFFDVSDDPNWQIKVGDGTDEEVYTSGTPADTDEIIHDIWVELDGTIHWAINRVEEDITGSISANKMEADAHYLIIGQLQSVTGAAVLVAEIDYIENEKFKLH